jgi:polynucleotide 5'-kinase involved in rRNA processing
VWIDTESGAEMKYYLCNMVKLNMMEEEFRARRIEERKRATYFTMQREMDREHEMKSERKRRHKSVRKYIMRRKLML